MSTKIYNAYIYDGSIQELHKQLNRMKKKYIESSISLFCKIVNSGVTEKQFVDGIKALSSILPAALEAKFLTECERTSSGYLVLLRFIQNIVASNYNNGFNIGASAVVYTHREKLIVQFFGVEPPKGNKKFIDFHYQNQTDQPKGISNKEWRERERVWDEIFKYDDIPSNAGFTYEFYNDPTASEIAYEVNRRLFGDKEKF